ncbi:MAG: hypothetical protein JXQ87_01505 [Bacteroidia bacterium]
MKNLLFLSLLLLGACVEIKEVAVFDQESQQKEPDGFNGFYSTEIYSDFITQEIWTSGSSECLLVENTQDVKYSGEGALHLKWDKVSQACEWLGIGIGWDSWAGKDLSNIVNTSAIEMMVRNGSGSRKGLPLAACLEDYSNGQAWIGFSANAVLAEEIGEDWVKVRLPLREFEWDAANGANPSNIKQMLIQFEADGDIYIDDIKVVEFNGSFRKRAIFNVNDESTTKIDGSIAKGEWSNPLDLEGNKVYMHADKDFIYLASTINDETPMVNNQTNGEIWNGDAIEIAFTTKAVQGKPSPYFKSFNQHVGISLTNNPTVWDWNDQTSIEGAEVSVKSNGNSVTVEAKLPRAHFGEFTFTDGEIYGLEVAIDQGGAKGRTNQIRWNEPNSDAFSTNPVVWGEMIIY